MSTPRFTPEFKQEAVRQIVERGHSVAEWLGSIRGRRSTVRCVELDTVLRCAV